MGAGSRAPGPQPPPKEGWLSVVVELGGERGGRGAAPPAPQPPAQQLWLSSVIELVGERLPALSTACTENVFDDCVP